MVKMLTADDRFITERKINCTKCSEFITQDYKPRYLILNRHNLEAYCDKCTFCDYIPMTTSLCYFKCYHEQLNIPLDLVYCIRSGDKMLISADNKVTLYNLTESSSIIVCNEQFDTETMRSHPPNLDSLVSICNWINLISWRRS